MNDRPEQSISIITIPVLLFIAGIFLFVALLQRESELALWGVSVTGLAAAAKLWSRAGSKRLYCAASVDRQRAFPGDAVTLSVKLENRKLLPVLVRIGLDEGSGGLEPAGSAGCLKEVGLLWYQKAAFHRQLTAVRRGVYNTGASSVEAGDYPGFFRKRISLEPVEVIVYPRVFPFGELPLSGRDFFGKSGLHSPVHDPVYILGTRDYQHWQPARFIHWKASSRYNRLMEKIFDPSEQEKILIAVDASGYNAEDVAPEEYEKTIEDAASLVVHLEDRGIMTGFVTNAVLSGDGRAVVRPGRGAAQLSAILETMARMERKYDNSLVDVFSRGRVFSRGISCVLFSLDENEIIQSAEYLKSRRVPVTPVFSREPAVVDETDA